MGRLAAAGPEIAADGIRTSKGEAIVHATSARGADHLRPHVSCVGAFGYRDEDIGIAGEISCTEDGNKWWAKPFQELPMATNLLGMCLFASTTLAIKASSWTRLLSAAVGHTVSKQELLPAAERVIALERMVNARFGFDRKDDTLPKRFLTEPAPDGRGQGRSSTSRPRSTAITSPWGGIWRRACPNLTSLTSWA